ncbi:MAG: matrixin family metalloprotease [Pseudomonadota bacterium]
MTDRMTSQHSYCSMPEIPERTFDPSVPPGRASLINTLANKWVNGTVLHYYFFDQPQAWTTTEAEKDVVRQAFRIWKDVGIGLDFEEVSAADEAEIRIGFQRGDGAWSYVGTGVLNIGTSQRTMNFGWDLTRRPQEIDTAVHEIGHTLGFPHEHQNPNAGIVWDEEAVYTALGGPPNNWSREKTFHNIIRKIRPDTVQGSAWDPHSIMHYPFEAGLIQQPANFQAGLDPEPGLSDRDKEWVKSFYPALVPNEYRALEPFRSVTLDIAPGGQGNFSIRPSATRDYDIRTFGTSDTILVLFEDDGGELRYMEADDDSGRNLNAHLEVRLVKGRSYVLRVRLYHEDRAGETAVMMW